MQRLLGIAVLVSASFAFLPPALWASGGSSMPRPSGTSSMPPAPRKTPEQEAVDHYNAGLKYRDKAVALQKEAAQAGSEKERAKLEKKAQKEFEKAIDELLQAMKGWVEKRRAEPGTLAPDTVQEFSRWVGQREELAGQTPSVSELQQRKW